MADWIEWKRHQIWIGDITHFPRAGRVAYAILDVATRKSARAPTSPARRPRTQVEVVFTQALDTEGLWPVVEARQAERARHGDDGSDGDQQPILLAMSDNATPNASRSPPETFLALCAHRVALRPARHPDGPGM